MWTLSGAGVTGSQTTKAGIVYRVPPPQKKTVTLFVRLNFIRLNFIKY